MPIGRMNIFSIFVMIDCKKIYLVIFTINYQIL